MRVLVAVGGSIAAYKAVEVVRRLDEAGFDVQVAMTEAAQRFVAPLSFAALTRRPVLTSLWAVEGRQIEHVEQGHGVDLVLVAPASANLLARMAAGIADDVVTATLLSSRAPVLVAPAMESNMWAHPATAANVATLEARGVRFIPPEPGALASGREGQGRLAEVPTIVEAVRGALGPKDLSGIRLTITAGPTVEKIDPVRVLSNRSTGAMGLALARAALRRGAEVRLILGPTHLVPPAGAEVHRVESALEMLAAGEALIGTTEILIAAAAVSDYRVEAPHPTKLKRGSAGADALRLIENPDVLATLASQTREAVIVGFAAETEEVVARARGKLRRKGCDLVIGNRVGPAEGFGPGATSVVAVFADGTDLAFGPASKDRVADFVLDQALVAKGKRSR